MASLSEMTTRVTTILIDTPAELTNLIPQELDAAQREVEDRYAFLAMKAFVSGLIGPTFSDNSIDVPSDFLRTDMSSKPSWADSTEPSVTELDWIPTNIDLNALYNLADTTNLGSPKHIYRLIFDVSGTSFDRFNIYPYPDTEGPGSSGEYAVTVPYLKRLAAPSTNPSTETWFMSDMDRYLVFKAASELLTMNRDHEEGQLYALKAEREFKRVMRQDKRSRMKGTTLRVQRDANAAFNQEMQGLP